MVPQFSRHTGGFLNFVKQSFQFPDSCFGLVLPMRIRFNSELLNVLVSANLVKVRVLTDIRVVIVRHHLKRDAATNKKFLESTSDCLLPFVQHRYNCGEMVGCGKYRGKFGSSNRLDRNFHNVSVKSHGELVSIGDSFMH